MNEFELIREISARVKVQGTRSVVLGIGDDAAVLAVEDGHVVATTDSLVEGVHFTWDICSPEDVGYRALAVNLSDLAAMGSRPTGLLLSFSIPKDMDDSIVLRVAGGVGRGARRFGVPVVGGNVSRSLHGFIVTVTALGSGLGPWRRAGTVPGDGIWISGPLGGASMGLYVLLERPELVARFDNLVRAWRRPVPRIDLVEKLSGNSDIHAAIDVSDGFLADLGHVLDSSNAGARISIEKIPVQRGLKYCAKVLGRSPVTAVLTGGEDYQLVIMAAKSAEKVLSDVGAVRIGEVTRSRKVSLFDGVKSVDLPAVSGHMHR